MLIEKHIGHRLNLHGIITEKQTGHRQKSHGMLMKEANRSETKVAWYAYRRST